MKLLQKLRTGHRILKRFGQRNQVTSLTVMLTGRCYSKCVFCNIGRLGGQDLPTWDLLHGVEENFPALQRVALTGGEPMLHYDLHFVYGMLSQKYQTTLVTNGQHPGRIKLFMNAFPGASLTTSLHDLGVRHDCLMGVSGAFARWEKSLEYYEGVGMTVCSLNYQRILDVYDFVDAHGLQFGINPVDFSEVYYENRPNGLALTSEMREVVATQLEQLPKTLWRSLQTQWLRGQRPDLQCWAGRTQAFLHWTGVIYPCIYWDYQLGCLPPPNTPLKRANFGQCTRCFSQCEMSNNLLHDSKFLMKLLLTKGKSYVANH